MSGQKIRAVIGKGFGDEGKGLAVDYFCSKVPETIVIKHNGGAQAGHTVELGDKRFVFHQLSSGSFRHADTLWAETYYPDLYKLREEVEAFRGMSGFTPRIHGCENTPITIISDVLVNELLETARGEGRHGSCGMGINEADLRTKAGYGITLRDILGMSAEKLALRMKEIRDCHYEERLRSERWLLDALKTDAQVREYYELFQDQSVLENAAEEMLRSAEEFVTVSAQVGELLGSREEIIFETGQGLLLDAENEEYLPHVSASRTGLKNVVSFLNAHGLPLDEVIYVSRSYVTRHGAGPLPMECSKEALGITEVDQTNMANPWQGSIRYARHGSISDFMRPVHRDLKENGRKEGAGVSLFMTHLNETKGRILMADGDLEWRRLADEPSVRATFDAWYVSDTREAKDVKRILIS